MEFSFNAHEHLIMCVSLASGGFAPDPTNGLSVAPARCIKDPSFVPHSSYISSV